MPGGYKKNGKMARYLEQCFLKTLINNYGSNHFGLFHREVREERKEKKFKLRALSRRTSGGRV
jgi:hypothetical protein